ncbi:MAG TPA: hypothetical protein VHF47_09010 [Acidimicrobiales bacterium]|nr:hypothetical protein [Acidimicrobiales bacterium]
MFFPGSRYEKEGTYQVAGPDGAAVTVTRLPVPPRRGTVALLGYHRREETQRLDHLAAHFLADPTAFWRLCDANSAVSPDALAARQLVAVPRKER